MELIVATNNQGKVREFKNKLQNFDVFSLKDKGIVIEVEEDGTTFEENAVKKARAVCDLTGKLTIADDSGLEVFALNNAPGIYSARYGGEGLSDEQRYVKLLDEMQDKTDRGARFVSVIAICYPDGRDVTLRGECYGEILKAPMGDGGFGYDPVFYYPPFDKTFGDLTLEEKNKVSHRAKALEKLERFFENGSAVLDNGVLRAEIVSRGAEVRKLTDATGADLLNTDLKKWNYTSPVLFPILGKPQDAQGYYFQNEYYRIAPHGFARDTEFLLVHASDSEATYLLSETPETLKSYPFKFRLYVTHKLENNFWKVSYKVENADDKEMFYNIGSHEAYKIGADWENYSVEFEKEENLKENWLKSRSYRIQRDFKKAEKSRCIYDKETNRDMFFFFKNIASSWIQLCHKGAPKVRVHFNKEELGSFGFWRSRQANFFCLEPWSGISDTQYPTNNAEEKEFYRHLKPGESYQTGHDIEFFL